MQIRKYLGIPSLYANAYYNVNSSLDDITPEIQTDIEATLARLVLVETALDDTLDTAGIATIGPYDPSFFQGAKLSEIRAEGRRLCTRISVILGIDIQKDAFAESTQVSWGGFFG